MLTICRNQILYSSPDNGDQKQREKLNSISKEDLLGLFGFSSKLYFLLSAICSSPCTSMLVQNWNYSGQYHCHLPPSFSRQLLCLFSIILFQMSFSFMCFLVDFSYLLFMFGCCVCCHDQKFGIVMMLGNANILPIARLTRGSDGPGRSHDRIWRLRGGLS